MTGVRRIKKDLTAVFQQKDENIISGTTIYLVPRTLKIANILEKNSRGNRYIIERNFIEILHMAKNIALLSVFSGL